ncbi:unnamed protein product [Dicrocoelium dendriticum]|nr:unnamed protein product [Dicrocoelium dendriticum]
MSSARRVVVTGLGVCSPIGLSVERFWQGLLNGVTGITHTSEEFSFLPSRVAGIIPENELSVAMAETQSYLNEHQSHVDWRNLSRANAFAICAAKQALIQAGWKPCSDPRLRAASTRAGVHIGVCIEGVHDIIQTGADACALQYKDISPYTVTRILKNMPAGTVSRLWGLRGPCLSLSTACTTGLHSIGDAYRIIQNGEADFMLAGACEASVEPWVMGAFCRIRGLCSTFNDNPTEASRPFDELHAGFVISEGAGAVVLQAWPPPPEIAAVCEHVSTPIAEVIGFGRSADAYSLVSPEPTGDGAYRSMQAALMDAKLDSLDQLDHINCHATSTPLGDTIELAAVSRLLLDYTGKRRADTLSPIVINSIKGHLGHLLGGAGAVESIYTALAVNRGLIAGNRNLHNPIGFSQIESIFKGKEDKGQVAPQVAANASQYVKVLERQTVLPRHDVTNVHFPDQTSSDKRRIALTNSFGFGGTNGSLVFAEWKD